MEVGRYQITREIGHGNMGVVYLANDPMLNRQVALKVINKITTDPKEMSFLAREAQAVARFSHRGIVQIHDLGLDKNHMFFVMEYVKGIPLDEWLLKNGICSEASLGERLSLFTAILEAVNYAHNQGVIHRDIKPSNIIITENGTPKLLDFGLACLDDSHSATHTHTGMGTPMYLSPEQLRQGSIDKRTDIFSLGVVFYELMTGRVPYSSISIDALYNEILNVAPTSPRQYNHTLPLSIEKIIMRMLSKDCDARYASISEILSELPRLDYSKATATISMRKPQYKNPVDASPIGGTQTVAIPFVQRYNIIASPNVRYAAIARQNTIFLYRSTDSLWARSIPDLKEIIFVSDSGSVFYRTTNALYKATADPSSKPIPLPWDLDLLDLCGETGTSRKIVIDDEGRNVVAEILGPPPPDTSLWRRLIYNTKATANMPHHVLYAIMDGGKHPFSIFKTPASPDGSFFWNVSPSLNYLVTAVWKGNGHYVFEVYHHLNHKLVGNFQLPPCTVRDIKVTDKGRVIIHVTSLAGPQLLVVRDLNKNSISFSLPPNVTILNVWKELVCYSSSHEVTVQRFDGTIISQADTTPLEKFHVSYAFCFDRKDNLTLLMCNTQDIWIMPIEPQHLDQTNKRWKRILAMRDEYEEELRTKDTREQEIQQNKMERYDNVRDKLTNSLNEILNKRLHKELDEQAQQGELTYNAVHKAVATALHYTESTQNGPSVPGNEPTVRLRYHEMPPQPNAINPIAIPNAGSDRRGLITNLPQMRSHEAIVADIKRLCELNQTGRISPEGYTMQLGRLSDELLKIHSTR